MSEEERQPDQLPAALEAGTLNTVGIAGLGAALRYLQERGQSAIRTHEIALTTRLIDGLRDAPGIRLLGTGDATRQVATVSLTVDGWEPVDVAAVLDSTFGIAVRAGLHCAPSAHRTIGTFPRGTVRLSPGCFSTDDEVDQAIAALRSLAGSVA